VEPLVERSPRRVLSVSELLVGLRGLFEDAVGRVWVAGEVSNLRRASSGHLYFTLKDEGAQVRAVLFRASARRVAFEPQDGMAVLAYGDLAIFEPRGDLQLLVRALEPRGVGALQLAFEQLRARLAAEGLFDAERKRPLPAHPRRVGVVTSPGGAALRDVIQVSRRRCPAVPLLVAPTRVQGEGAEEEIAAALARVAREPEVDVVLLVRGGGSLEDLLAFNGEVVARAIRFSPVPVVSGVGHETDVTIADLAADARAATPSAAAMLALPDRAALRAQLARDLRRLAGAVRALLAARRARARQEGQALAAFAPRARLAAQGSRLAATHSALARAGRALVERRRARLAAAAGRLDSLSPLAVLARGYALVRLGRSGPIVRRAEMVARGDRLHVRLAAGELEAIADAVGPRDEESATS
jgi:exodeoxyribonuclease VII large subunit